MVNLYSVYDRKGPLYEMPFPARTHAEAVRMMQECLLNKRPIQFSLAPADFELWQVCVWNETKGDFIPERELVCSLDVLQTEEQKNDQNG